MSRSMASASVLTNAPPRSADSRFGPSSCSTGTACGDETGAANRIPAQVLLEGERPLPEVTEALIGACFLAFGFERIAAAVAEAFEPRISPALETRIDFKSALQEMLARRGAHVSYEVISEVGPPHERTFEVSAVVEEDEVGRGSGRSKKAAEQVAAEQALERLGG